MDNRRPYGLPMAAALAVGGMIGPGIFLLPGQIARFGMVSVAGWSCAIAGAMLLAWLIGKLTQAMPDADGAVTMCTRALGPIPGVLIGWSYWASNCSANAFYALGAVRYLALVFPKLAANTDILIMSANIILWGLTVLNLGGARGVGWFQLVSTVLKLIPLIVALLVVMWLGAHGMLTEVQPHVPLQIPTITHAIGYIFFAMLGFEGVAVVAGMVREPAHNVPRAMMLGTGLTGGLYLILCTGILLALPNAALRTSGAPVAFFLETYLGHGVGPVVSLFVAIAAIGALNGWLLINAELPLGMARAGLLPKAFTRLSGRDVPVRLLLLSSGTSCAMILFGRGQTTSGLLDFMQTVT
ncbi:MAG: amino acid permease, partial [Alphaproteobacteria bacterium]|nr:amino acid permease [Alphaproteobacteria bacterium]